MAALTTLMLAACSANASSSSSSSSSAGPIKIGLGSVVIPGVYDSQVQFLAGIKAAEGYIKERGGWGGRTVQLVQCQSPGDPASDLKCYHDFVGSQTVAVMGLLENSPTYLQLLVKAHIPALMLASTPSEAQSSWEMSLPGIIESYTAAAHYACAKGLKHVAVFQQDLPTARVSEAAFAQGIFSKCGIQVNNVYMPLGTADPAPYIQKAVAGNPQLLFMSGQAAPITTFLNAFSTAGFPIDRVLTAPTSAPGWLSNPKAKGILLMARSGYPAPQSTDPDMQTFLKYMKKYSPGADPAASLSLPAFEYMLMIWETGKAIGFSKLTGQAIHDYMNNVAPGHLKVFAGDGNVAIPAGWAGVKSPYQRILQWTGSEFADKGWWAGDWTCNSASTCTSLTPPPGSKP